MIVRVYGVVVALLVSLAPTLLRAQASPRSVSGVVRDTTGRPLADASIALDPDGDIRVARADGAGRFRFDNVSPGRHALRVVWIGYQPHESELDVPAAGIHVNIALVRLTHRLDTLRVEFRRTGVFGVVTNSDFKPTIKASIEVMGTRHRMVTAADGRFEFADLREGGYVVSVKRDGFKTRLISIAVPPQGAVEVAAVLDSLDTRSEQIAERYMRDMEWRIHRRTPNQSAIVARQELGAVPGARLNEALRYAPSVYSRGMIVQGAEICHLYVNGKIEKFLELKDFRADDVDMLEVYTQQGCREEVPGTRTSVVRRTGRPAIVIWLWLKGGEGDL